jgi:hypothetical protein
VIWVYHNVPNSSPEKIVVTFVCSGPRYNASGDGGIVNLVGINGSNGLAQDPIGDGTTSYGPEKLNFFNQGISSPTDPAILDLQFTTNVSWLTVTPSSVGLMTSGFAVSQSSSSHKILASCADQVLGLRTGKITLTTNTAQTVTWTVNLMCRGSEISVLPNQLPLVNVDLNSSVSRQLNIQNLGNWYLEVFSITSDQPWIVIPNINNSKGSSTNFTWAETYPIQGNWRVNYSYPNITVIAMCGSVAETRTGTLKLYHDSFGVPNPLLVPISIQCQ